MQVRNMTNDVKDQYSAAAATPNEASSAKLLVNLFIIMCQRPTLLLQRILLWKAAFFYFFLTWNVTETTTKNLKNLLKNLPKIMFSHLWKLDLIFEGM